MKASELRNFLSEQIDENGDYELKDCRTWENFKAPWKHKHFESYQKVLYKLYACGKWKAGFYSHYLSDENEQNGHIIMGIDGAIFGDELVIPYEGNENLLGKEVEE